MTNQGTCSEACWHAREPVCHCACNGANHGCLLVNGAPEPARTKRKGETRWRLFGVVGHWEVMDTERYLGSAWAYQAIPGKCKWPEAQNRDDSRDKLLWVRVDLSEDVAAAGFLRAKQMAALAHRRFHITYDECNGITQRGFGKTPARHCTDPAAHALNPALDALFATLLCSSCEPGLQSPHQWHDKQLCACPQCNQAIAAA